MVFVVPWVFRRRIREVSHEFHILLACIQLYYIFHQEIAVTNRDNSTVYGQGEADRHWIRCCPVGRYYSLHADSDNREQDGCDDKMHFLCGIVYVALQG